jgi:hypothetical protein
MLTHIPKGQWKKAQTRARDKLKYQTQKKTQENSKHLDNNENSISKVTPIILWRVK